MEGFPENLKYLLNNIYALKHTTDTKYEQIKFGERMYATSLLLICFCEATKMSDEDFVTILSKLLLSEIKFHEKEHILGHYLEDLNKKLESDKKCCDIIADFQNFFDASRKIDMKNELLADIHQNFWNSEKDCTKLSQISKNISSLLTKYVKKLWNLKRTGWVRMQVHDPESVAAHMFGMASLLLFCVESSKTEGYVKFNVAECLKMILIHDLGESIVGDITPVEKVPKEVKSEMEKNAIETIFQEISQNLSEIDENFAKRMKDVIVGQFLGYEAHKTPESKICKGIDLLDMELTGLYYQATQDAKLSSEGFFKDAEQLKDDKELLGSMREIAELVIKFR